MFLVLAVPEVWASRFPQVIWLLLAELMLSPRLDLQHRLAERMPAHQRWVWLLDGFEQHNCSSLACPVLWNVLTGAFLFTGAPLGFDAFLLLHISSNNIYCYRGFRCISVAAVS